MNSYDVRFWDPRKIGDTARGRWRVRWAVAGREHCRSFPAKAAGRRVPDRPEESRPRPPAVRHRHRAARHLPAAGRRRRLSPGMSTPTPTPKSSGRTWPPPPAARPPRR